MAVQRFLPDVERTRRAAGWIFLAIGSIVVLLVCWGAIVFARVTVTTVVFVVVPAAFAALGARFAFKRDVVIDVDVEQRRYSVIRSGQSPASGPLDDLGPIEVSQRTRVSGTGNNRRTVVEYVVSAAVHSKIDLYVLTTPAAARRKAEALARLWHLPCRSLGGAVRAAKDLDVPLHERLRGNREALTATTLRPEWGVKIEPVFRGQSLVSTHRSWAPLAQGAFVALAPIVVIWWTSSAGSLLSHFREASGDVMDKFFLGLLAAVALALLANLARGARDTFLPGTVQANENGVSYRGRTMRYRDIEEVIAGVPIEIVGDRRTMSLAVTFCPPGAIDAVAHELQRLILEVAPRS